jgi:predicted RNA-binding protein YlqC (UPF0109 family)
MKHFLDFVLRRLVENPDDVDVCEVLGDKQLTFKVSLNPADIGKVIGKNGRTISAIRTLLNAAASKADMRVIVEILETSPATS